MVSAVGRPRMILKVEVSGIKVEVGKTSGAGSCLVLLAEPVFCGAGVGTKLCPVEVSWTVVARGIQAEIRGSNKIRLMIR